MDKYAPLGDYLRAQQRREARMSFDQIEQVAGVKLPRKARLMLAWWRTDPASNVLIQAVRDAGFQVGGVDIGGGEVVLTRIAAEDASEAATAATRLPLS